MRTILADGHKSFGGMASEPEISGQVEKCNFYLLHKHLMLPFGVIPLEFHRDVFLKCNM